MKKLMMSLLCCTICGTVLTTGSVNAQGDSSTNSESLKELQNEGIVSKSITEQQWQQMKAQERKDEAEFEKTAEVQWQKQQKQDRIDRENRSRKKKFHLKKGDFFITNNVSSKGFTGHAAIYTGKGNPKHRYIKVYRASKKYRGKAGSYAKSHFNGVPYSITTNPYSKSVTYCSKLVWQSYYYGAGRLSVLPVVTSQFIIEP